MCTTTKFEVILAKYCFLLLLGCLLCQTFFFLICNFFFVFRVPTSQCGPFQGYPYMYQMILEGILHLQQGSQLSNIILFLTRPGFVAGLLIAMG